MERINMMREHVGLGREWEWKSDNVQYKEMNVEKPRKGTVFIYFEEVENLFSVKLMTFVY